jgi:hypothetical protein
MAPPWWTITRITDVWRPDIVLSAGDMVAGQKADLPDTRFPEMWAFDAAVAAHSGIGIPFGFALGITTSALAPARLLFARAPRRRLLAEPGAQTAARVRDDHDPFASGVLFGDTFFPSVDARRT